MRYSDVVTCYNQRQIWNPVGCPYKDARSWSLLMVQQPLLDSYTGSTSDPVPLHFSWQRHVSCTPRIWRIIRSTRRCNNYYSRWLILIWHRWPGGYWWLYCYCVVSDQYYLRILNRWKTTLAHRQLAQPLPGPWIVLPNSDHSIKAGKLLTWMFSSKES